MFNYNKHITKFIVSAYTTLFKDLFKFVTARSMVI